MCIRERGGLSPGRDQVLNICSTSTLHAQVLIKGNIKLCIIILLRALIALPLLHFLPHPLSPARRSSSAEMGIALAPARLEGGARR